MNERQVLEDLLKDAETMVAKLKARLAEQSPVGTTTAQSPGPTVDASAIDVVESQKTSDNTGNY